MCSFSQYISSQPWKVSHWLYNSGLEIINNTISFFFHCRPGGSSLLLHAGSRYLTFLLLSLSLLFLAQRPPWLVDRQKYCRLFRSVCFMTGIPRLPIYFSSAVLLCCLPSATGICDSHEWKLIFSSICIVQDPNTSYQLFNTIRVSHKSRFQILNTLYLNS